jgi:hypothetical protein
MRPFKQRSSGRSSFGGSGGGRSAGCCVKKREGWRVQAMTTMRWVVLLLEAIVIVENQPGAGGLVALNRLYGWCWG